MFHQGLLGWGLIAIALGVMVAIVLTRTRDSRTRRLLRQLDAVPVDLVPVGDRRLAEALEPADSGAPTAILCVEEFSAFGLHLVATVCRLFPSYFTNFIFVARGEPDLVKYVVWARRHGLRAHYRNAAGADLLAAFQEVCRELVHRYPRCVVFLGKPIFREREYSRSFSSRMATTLERRLRFEDIQTIVLPIGAPGS